MGLTVEPYLALPIFRAIVSRTGYIYFPINSLSLGVGVAAHIALLTVTKRLA